MTDYGKRFDIFLCGGSQHVELLRSLLPKLLPYGTVHLGSSFLSDADLAQLRGLYDVLHTPRHSDDGYRNFELFTIRDVNRLATAPYFIKLDADVDITDDWVTYVDEALAAHPDAVLFGPDRGNVDVNFEISGALVRDLLQRDIYVTNGLKVIGAFYVGRTAFFKEHLRFMDLVHEFMWCYKDGVRKIATPYPQYWNGVAGQSDPITVIGTNDRFPGNEDTLRSLVVHAVGAGDRLHVLPSHGKVRIDRSRKRAQAG